ncbi:MAG: SMP-30/gluconolactonase/LRE family protein [Myxococcota bacterium]
MKRLVPAALGILFGVGAYLGFGPTAIEPVAWQPPPPTPLEGVYAPNTKLAAVEWWARGLVGPEAITFDAQGRLVTGLKDGRIVRLSPGNDEATLVADTKGRPLALAYHPDGRLIICDAHAGLLALTEGGALEVLSTGEGGVPFRFVDDLAITKSGVIYFSDATTRHPIERFTDDLMEHQTTGRLLKYDPATKQTTRVADGFSFANGVALGPDEAWVLLAETGAYRLWRVWLTGDKAGKKEVFLDALPGFPDNVRYSPERHVFWVAIGSPRNRLVDGLAGWPGLRKALSRLPRAVQPAPARHAFVLAVDETGKPVESLQHAAPDSYSPIASAVERDGFLYFGSFAREGIARLKLAP